MRIAWSSLAPILAAAALAVACGGATTPSLPPTAATPTGSPTAPAVVGTGIRSTDAAIAAVLAGDEAALLKLVRYTPTACATAPQGLGAPPVCLSGEAAGAPVDVFQVAQCEGVYVRPADVHLDIPPGARLYGAYRVTHPFWPAGAYAAIFGRPESAANTTGWELILNDEGVVGVHLGCGMTPMELVAFQRLSAAIVAPAGAPVGTASPTALP